MNIVQVYNGVVPPVGYGGIERMVFWLSRCFVQLGHSVTLVCQLTPEHLNVLNAHGITAVSYPSALKDLARLVPDADVLHFHECLPAGYEPHAPYLVTEHGNHRKKGVISRNTVFLSQSHAHNHKADYFVPNGIPLEQYPLCLDKTMSLLFMAKLGWKKKNAKTAINLALDTDTPINVCGGDVWQERKVRGLWQVRHSKAKIHRTIQAKGNVDGDEKLHLLQRSGLLFYLVNWQEPFALAPHEAFATGTPVLATPNGALSEYVEEGKNGFLVKNYSQAVDAVRQFKAMSESDRQAMYQHAHRSAFSIEKSAQGYLDFYKTVMRDTHLYSEKRQLRYAPARSITIKKWLG